MIILLRLAHLSTKNESTTIGRFKTLDEKGMMFV